VDAVFDAVASREGVVSYLVCCAGIFSSRPFLQLSPDDWERTIRINLTGSFLCCRAALRSMQKNGFGRIVLISSVLARGGGMNCASYAASKGGVLGLARSLALEVAGENIRVNTLTPGITDTAMPRGHISEEQLRKIASANPLGRIGRVEDMVEGCLFLLSEDSSYVTAQDLRVNGGGALW
jgi:NAD(P)-dependent dehydrogenase (short-subunit alcohol dehydrogenase family)